MKYYTKGWQSQKSYGHICNTKIDALIPVIDRYKKDYGITRICAVLGIARASYYKALNKEELPRAKENRFLKETIKKIYDESEGRYGSHKIHKQLIEIYNLKVSEKEFRS